MGKRKIYLSIVALVLGFLIVAQIRSFVNVNDILIRDSQSNVFEEIKILKVKNGDLRKEIDELDTTLEQLNDQNLALKAIDDEITRYKKLDGKYPVFGPGVKVMIDSKITTPWIVDLINAFFSSGAQAVSVNGIRITSDTVGIDTLPQGQILLNGSIISPPYIFNVIGSSSGIVDALETPGGIFDKLEATFPDIVITTEKNEIVQLD